MPDKFSRTPTSRLKVQQKQSLSHNCEENGIKSSISYLDKLPSDMLTNMYKPTKRQQQPATSIHELIFSRLREIDRQYYEETSAQVVKNLRGLVHQSINTSVINGADSNKHLCHDNVIRTHNNISVRSQKTLAPPTLSRETRSRSKCAQRKLSQLLGNDYDKPQTTVSSSDVFDYLNNRSGLIQQDIGKCLAECRKKRQNADFEAKLTRIEALVASPEGNQCQHINLSGSLDYDDTKTHIANRPITNNDSGCTTFSIASFHEHIPLSRCSKGSAYRSSAGETLDEPVEKIRMITHGNSLGPAEHEKKRFENKKRILLQALKRTNSYTVKDEIINKLHNMMG